jgi:hypothetical protein
MTDPYTAESDIHTPQRKRSIRFQHASKGAERKPLGVGGS